MMIQFVKGCLAHEEKNRLAWKEIFSHQIFEKISKIKEIEKKDQPNEDILYQTKLAKAKKLTEMGEIERKEKSDMKKAM